MQGASITSHYSIKNGSTTRSLTMRAPQKNALNVVVVSHRMASLCINAILSAVIHTVTSVGTYYMTETILMPPQASKWATNDPNDSKVSLGIIVNCISNTVILHSDDTHIMQYYSV